MESDTNSGLYPETICMLHSILISYEWIINSNEMLLSASKLCTAENGNNTNINLRVEISFTCKI